MLTQKRMGVLLSYLNLIAKNLVTFIYTPILLRFLGQSEYGLYQMVNSVISGLLLLDLGFGSAYIRFYARAKAEKSEKKVQDLNGLYLLIFLFLSLIALALGAMLIFNISKIFGKTFTPKELITTKYLMILMIFNIVITFPSSVFDSNIIANEQFRFQRSRQLFQTVVTPILTLPLLFFGMKSISIVIVQTAITLLFLFLNIKFATVNLKMKFKFDNLHLGQVKEIMTFSFFIFLNQIIDQINWNLPNFLLGMFSGASQVAIFAIANQIKNIFITLSTALSGVFVPQINEIVSTTNDNEKLTQIMTKVGRVQMIILTYVLGGFILLGQYFIKIWAGKSYEEAYPLALLLVLPFLVTLIQNTGYEIVRAKNMHQFRAIVEFIFALVNIGITTLFIKHFGLMGSAMGTLITMIIVSWFIMNWFYMYRVKLNMKFFWKEIFKTTPPSIISMILVEMIILIIPINNLLIFILFGFLYTLLFLFIYYLIVSTENEKNFLKSVFSKIRH